MTAKEELSEGDRTLALTRYKTPAPQLEGERTLRSVAVDAGVPFGTAQRWVEHYRKSGLAALARKRRSDEGSRKACSQRVLEAIEGLALERSPLPVTASYRQVKVFADANGESMPSYPAVHRIVRRIPTPCSRSLTRVGRHTARALTWFTGEKPPVRTLSGKPTMLSLTFCWYETMARPPGRGSRQSSTTTVERSRATILVSKRPRLSEPPSHYDRASGARAILTGTSVASPTCSM